MKIAFIMDPLEGVKAYKDTSYFLMLAARQKGHTVYYLDQEDLYSQHNRLFAQVQKVDVHEDHDHPFTVLRKTTCALDEMDAVMVRTEPPFDRRYFYTTLMLDLLPSTTRVVNRPSGLRNWNEKLAALEFPEYTPQTLITQSSDEIRSFMAARGKVTLKPIDGYGGRGIFFLEPGAPNADQLIQMLTHDGRQRIIAQEYIPEAKDGDKRVLLLNGKVLGGVLRVHQEGKELNNLDSGGSAHPTTLTERELEICKGMEQGIREQGILFCGIDFLGEKLIEVNVTSPTCLRELTDFSGIAYHHQVIDAVFANDPNT